MISQGVITDATGSTAQQRLIQRQDLIEILNTFYGVNAASSISLNSIKDFSGVTVMGIFHSIFSEIGFFGISNGSKLGVIS